MSLRNQETPRPDSAESMLLGYMQGFGAIRELLEAAHADDNTYNGHLTGVGLIFPFFETICKAIPKISGCLVYEYRPTGAKLTTVARIDKKNVEIKGTQCIAAKMLRESRLREVRESLSWNHKEHSELLDTLSKDAGQQIFYALGFALTHELIQHDSILVCHGTTKESAFLSQDKVFLDMFIKIILLTLGTQEKRINEKKKRIIEKVSYKKSAHTFEKCYNTPIRNMCYLLRQFIHPYNDRARQLTFGIQDYIDLWANHHSANITLSTTASKQWIECFRLEKIKKDLENFSRHMLTMRLNDLFDDCYEFREIGNEKAVRQESDTGRSLCGEEDRRRKSRKLQSAWDGALKVEDVFQFIVEVEDETQLFGIRPLFRVVMLNMLQNAIEALDLFNISKETKFFQTNEKRPEIKFVVTQSQHDTNIIVSNYGKIMPKEMAERLREIFDRAKNGRLPRYPDTKSGPKTTKSGTGSGEALWEAAYYFSCIKAKQKKEIPRGWIELKAGESELSELNIHLPFGTVLIENYKRSRLDQRQLFDKVQFDWGRDELLTRGNQDERG